MIKPECERKLKNLPKPRGFPPGMKGVTYPELQPLGLQFMMENKSEPFLFRG